MRESCLLYYEVLQVPCVVPTFHNDDEQWWSLTWGGGLDETKQWVQVHIPI